MKGYDGSSLISVLRTKVAVPAFVARWLASRNCSTNGLRPWVSNTFFEKRGPLPAMHDCKKHKWWWIIFRQIKHSACICACLGIALEELVAHVPRWELQNYNGEALSRRKNKNSVTGLAQFDAVTWRRRRASPFGEPARFMTAGQLAYV